MTDFRRRAFFETDVLLGVRWWQDALAAHADPVTRRHALRNILLLAAGAAGVGIVIELLAGGDSPSRPPILRDALELQKEQGWDVGRAGESLRFPGATAVDADGHAVGPEVVANLAELLAPAEARLRPFYVPTLFQAPAAPSSPALRQALSPVHDEAMDEGYARGGALAALLAGADAPAGTAILVDAPGPIAVSVAAGMAEHLAPVFLFDNWPHPAGVVPSHLALAAALYWLPRLQAAAAKRPADALPVFVGDDARLSAYSDASDRFDNRYLLRLPSAGSLQGLGIKHLLLVRPHGGDKELDDLNDDVVALAAAGITVKIVGLDDFNRGPAQAGAGEAAGAHHYYWGGSPIYYPYFWPTYGWGRTVVRSSPPPDIGRYGRGASYTPVARPTIFSSRAIGGTGGVGRARPTGFGVVSYRAGDSGRSGSWGRSSSSGSSGG